MTGRRVGKRANIPDMVKLMRNLSKEDVERELEKGRIDPDDTRTMEYLMRHGGEEVRNAVYENTEVRYVA